MAKRVHSIITGSKRAVARLGFLGFDPIGELVKSYNYLTMEIQRQESLRNCTIVEMHPVTGKIIYYNFEQHLRLIEARIRIAIELLRYMYGRVPENGLPQSTNHLPIQIISNGDVIDVVNPTADRTALSNLEAAGDVAERTNEPIVPEEDDGRGVEVTFDSPIPKIFQIPLEAES